MKTQATNNRETWLRKLAALMAPRFAKMGWTLPAYRVGTGFTSGGRKSRANGECWDKRVSADETFEIFITPDMVDGMEVAAVLCHELIHAAVGLKHGHKGEFAKMMQALGFLRPFTSSIPGDDFKAWVAPMLEKVGPIPHASLMYRGGLKIARTKEDGEEGEDGEEQGGDSSGQKKKQTTRMLKACCLECEYVVRLSRKWALELGAVCPAHGAMKIEGLEDDAGEE